MITTFLTLVFSALYFFLPAYMANMAPVFAAKIFGKKWDWPMDCGKSFRGKRILGDHKTWRGLVSGVLVAVVIIYLQAWLSKHYNIPLISAGGGSAFGGNYSRPDLWLVGGLLGLGAILGDAIKSFFKRQRGLDSGAKWPIFDQLDFVIGGLLLVSIIQPLSWSLIIVIVIVSPLLHILVNIIGFKLKIKDRPW